MKFTRDSKWGTHHGQRIRVRDMEDTHVANIYQFFLARAVRRGMSASDLVGDEVFQTFQEEIKLRGLSKAFLDAAPYPYRGPRGDLRIWDYNEWWSRPVRVRTKLTTLIELGERFV